MVVNYLLSGRNLQVGPLETNSNPHLLLSQGLNLGTNAMSALVTQARVITGNHDVSQSCDKNQHAMDKRLYKRNSRFNMIQQDSQWFMRLFNSCV
jgi:hypothetical protein